MTFDATLRSLITEVRVLPLVGEGWQLYTADQLGVWPHYITTSEDLLQSLDVARASGLAATS